MEFIDNIPYDGKTRLNAAIRNYSNLGGRGGISIILTDLFSSDGYEEALKYLQYKKQEITLVHIYPLKNWSLSGAEAFAL